MIPRHITLSFTLRAWHCLRYKTEMWTNVASKEENYCLHTRYIIHFRKLTNFYNSFSGHRFIATDFKLGESNQNSLQFNEARWFADLSVFDKKSSIENKFDEMIFDKKLFLTRRCQCELCTQDRRVEEFFKKKPFWWQQQNQQPLLQQQQQQHCLKL